MEYQIYIEDEIRQELEEGEQALWIGQPNPNKLFTKADIFLVPFTLLWAGFAFFFLSFAVRVPMIMFPIVSVLFCIVGLYVTIGRFFVKRRRKKRTIYLLTDRRVVEILDVANRRVKSVLYSQITGINHSRKRNGSGSITLGNTNVFQGMYANTGMDFGMFRNQGFPVFYDLEDVEEPLRIINEQMRKNDN